MSYPLAANTLGPEEIEAAKRVLDSGRLTMGDEVAAFEREFAERVGAEHAIMVNSGSSANLLMIEAMLRRSRIDAPWHPGDEIIVPALSWPTTIWPLAQLGLVPVFADVDPNTLAIDLESAKPLVSYKTRGVFLTHILGQPAAVDQFASFCKYYNLRLLEDACESLGAIAHGAAGYVGTFGEMGSFSLYYSHHISTIEGGVIVTSDGALADDLRSMRAHGWVRDRSDKATWIDQNRHIDPRFLFALPGYNVRPTEIQAAIGRVQLRKLDEMLWARCELAKQVGQWVKKHAPWLRLIGEGADGHSWMMLPFHLQPDAPTDIATVRQHLEAHGVDTRPIIAGNLVRHPAIMHINHRRAPSLRVADEMFVHGFMIGCHPVLTPDSLGVLENAIEGLRKL